ncbi:MAG: uncharacterized membrane protein YhaH (DUF805 family) [Cocleimonas sp.]|jgi:uncharacterized membrane protein YhaH (DUF805 family)
MSQDYNMNYINNSDQRYSDVDVLSTQGRIGRKRYFVYSTILPVLIFWAIATVAALVSYLPFASNSAFYGIMGLGIIATVWMMVHLTIQRCHDFNKSNSMAILAIVPFANVIFSLIPGTNGLNSYGEVPKPATWLFKFSFYAMIFFLLGIAIYAFTQLPISQFINNLIAY